MPIALTQPHHIAPAPLSLHPLHHTFGAEILGLDLALPLPEMLLQQLAAALSAHRLLLLRGQRLTAEQQAALTARLAPGQVSAQGLLPDGTAAWSHDPAAPTRPAQLQALFAGTAPLPGLATVFADQAAAHAGLGAWIAQRIEYLEAEHATPGGAVTLPLVRVADEGGQRSLFLGAQVTRLQGLPAAEAAALLPRLQAAATAPAVTWRHHWRRGDLVLWQGHALLHRQAGPVGLPLRRSAAAPAAPLGAAAVAVPWLIAG